MLSNCHISNNHNVILYRSPQQSLLNQYSIYTSPQSDLLLLVTMGEYTSAMEQFLVSTMGEAGIKKVSRAIDGALCSLLDVLIDHLTPEMERLSFWLGELRTLSYLPLAQKALYLRSGEVGAAERKALHCLVDLERLRNVTTRVASQYRTFFAWLVTALRRFPEDTVDTLMGYPLSYIDEVRLFLHTEFMTDSIEPLLSSSEQNEPRHPTASQHTPQSIDLNGDFNYDQDREDESEQWLHEVLDCLEQCVDLDSSKPDVQIASPVISKIISNIGLKQHIQDLQSSILEALNRPCASISARIDINNYASSMILKTRSSHDASHVPIAALRYQDNGDVSVAYTVDTGSESHIVVTTSRNEDDCVTVSAVTMPRRIKVANICPYKDNSWVLLSEASDVGAESYSCESALTLIPEDIFHEGQVNNRISFSDCTVPAGLTRREGASVLDLIATSLGSTRMDVDMCRKRLLPYEGCQPPLAVSSTRGTAFVLNGSQVNPGILPFESSDPCLNPV